MLALISKAITAAAPALKQHWRLIGVGLLLIALAVQTWRLDHTSGELALAKRTMEQTDKETKRAAALSKAATQRLAAKADAIRKEKDDEIKRIAGVRDDLLVQLRNRPRRPATPAADTGTVGENPPVGTGAALFAEDAEFLVREAARADRIRVELLACYSQYDAAVEEMALYANSLQGAPGDGN